MVEFRFFRPSAANVFLTGDFNGWREGQIPMLRQDDGYWVALLRLPAGSFRFRYCADGQYFADYAAFGMDHGPYGLDSIVYVPSRTLKVSPRLRQASAPRQAARAKAI